MTFENYQTWIWALYALSALVVLLVTFRITRSWHGSVKGFLRVTALVLMATPWYVQSDSMGQVAPAITIAVFEAVTSGVDNWKRAGIPLVTVLGLSYLLWLMLWWISSRFGSNKDDEDQQDSEHPSGDRAEPAVDGAEKGTAQ